MALATGLLCFGVSSRESFSQAGAPAVSLSASPSTISSGSTTILTWSSSNATACSGADGWSGALETSGSRYVSPTETTTYSLVCTNSGGYAETSTTIIVEGSSAPTVLFQQPAEPGIAGNLFVPPAAHMPPPAGVFELILWQPNPDSADGQLVPMPWDAGAQTGFTPPSPLSSAQLAFQDLPGSSTAQMYGDTVGAYINSADLPDAPPDQKMMITPQFIFIPGTQPVPFAGANSVLWSSMELQVPTAAGADTYVVADYLFLGPNGVRISYGIKLFGNGEANPVVGSHFDVDSHSYILNSPLAAGQPFATQAPGSASTADTPWLGWQPFAWSISQSQFLAALEYLAALYPDEVESTDPAAYLLAEVHLNAEMHFQPAPAALGWSMSGWTVWMESGG